MNKYQKKIHSLANCMPDIIPYKSRKKTAREAMKQTPQNTFRVLVEDSRKFTRNLVEDKTIRHWSDTYPHMIVSSAVVNMDNLLITWKTGQHSYESYIINEGYQVKVKMWCVHNNEEHREVFEKLSPNYFSKFKLVEGYNGFLPY